ncbi:hypothetical protein V6O07_18555, partial [Arthrospira platensis SPKY2]
IPSSRFLTQMHLVNGSSRHTKSNNHKGEMTMPAKQIPLNQVKRTMKHYFDTRSASALFDEFVAEVYDLKDMTTDDFVQLREKMRKHSRSAGVLVRFKKV